MADKAHKMTDEMLEELEKRIADQYALASRDMQKKFRDYMEQFTAQDAIQKKLLDAGKITEKEYSDWRFRHMMVGKRWEAMKDVLAKDLENAQNIALKISGEKMADVYALNANYAAWQIEHDGKIDAGFTLYNHDTAEYLLKDTRQLMPGPSTRKATDIAENKAMQWNKSHIQSAVLQGILQGEGPYQVAARLRSVAQMDYNASVRYARTMTTSAQNAGRYESYHRATKLGVHLTIEWQATLDDRTRNEHRLMHGQRRDVDEPFITPDGFTIYYPADSTGESDAPQSEIWNCFVGETKVASDCEIVRSYKHEYQGDLIRVVSAHGVEFTCTPNHPILTPFGWVPAEKLHKGDHMLVTQVGDDGSLVGNGNVYHVHSSFKALHDSLHVSGTTDNVPMADFNFHGDVPTSDVEVVSKERLLGRDGNTGADKHGNKVGFKAPDPFVLRCCHFVARLGRIDIPALRFVRRCRESLPFLGRRLSHAVIHRLRTIARRDVGIPEYAIDDLPAATVIRSELLHGLSGRVFVDDIVAVYKCSRSSGFPRSNITHVYNLQTENGYYFVGNSIPQNRLKSNGKYYAIAKNCRCTLLAWVKGYEHDTVKKSPGMGELSFEEWQKAKSLPDTESDRKQFQEYRKLLGSKAPNSYGVFREIKYGGSPAYDKLKQAAREARKRA